MNLEKIKNAKTKVLGKNIIYCEKIGSTQDEAVKIINNKVENGTIVIANSQTKGKGTKDHKWYTGKAKNIAMTIIIFPNCNIDTISNLTLLIANSIVNTIKQLYGYKLQIKVPNDVYLNNKKIAGILTQSSTIRHKVNHILIGIGFNVNEECFSKDTIDIATSLKKEFNKDFNREEIIVKFLENFEKDIEFLL